MTTHPRLTPAQEAVLHTLKHQPQPISAQTLYVLMRKQQGIGLATIYRSLDTLKRLGQVQHRVSITGEMLYSVVETEHHYLTCLQCGASIPLEASPIKELEARLQRSGSFKIYYHTLEFFGLCEPCAVRSG